MFWSFAEIKRTRRSPPMKRLAIYQANLCNCFFEGGSDRGQEDPGEKHPRGSTSLGWLRADTPLHVGLGPQIQGVLQRVYQL